MEKEQEVVKEENTVNISADELAKFKATHVSKEEYDKLLEEKNNLVTSILNGEKEAQTEEVEEDNRTLQDLADAIMVEDQTNLSYWQNVLAYRKKCIEEKDYDPFTPKGYKVSATDEDIAKAEKVANGIANMIERSNGNPNVFRQIYEAEVKDTTPVNVRRR